MTRLEYNLRKHGCDTIGPVRRAEIALKVITELCPHIEHLSCKDSGFDCLKCWLAEQKEENNDKT